ncbi:MAG: putative Ig domain-containing protein [Sulfuricella sp.]|nr:putative Ig domain-containing protein [Sulfuricella sp.]
MAATRFSKVSDGSLEASRVVARLGEDTLSIGTAEDIAIQSLKFADGSTFTIAEFIAQHPLDVRGTGVSGDLIGTPYRDTLQAGKGNQHIQGLAGADTYLYNLGDGADSIQDSGSDNNVLRFGAGITAEMLTVRRAPESAGAQCILDLGNGDSIVIGVLPGVVIHGVFDLDPFDGMFVKTMEFADGSVLDVKDFIMQHGLLQTGTDQADTLIGEDAKDGLIPDCLVGGAGNDTLIGGGGSDIYVFNRGDGADTIRDGTGPQNHPQWGWMPGGDNTLRFGKGIAAGDIVASYRQPTAQNNAYAIVLDLGGNDSVSLEFDQYSVEPAIQNVQFADGTASTLRNLLAQRDLKITGTNGNDHLYGFDGYSFEMAGQDGDDYLSANILDDTLAGGRGRDTLVGGGGNDTYLFNRGDGADAILDDAASDNTLSFGAGIAANDVATRWDPAANTLTLELGSGDQIAVGSLDNLAIQTLRFDDGTSLALADLLAQKSVIRLAATEGADVMSTFGGELPLQGLGGDDRLYGSVLADTLEGGAGNDVLSGGAGSDTYLYNLGDGADTVIDQSNGDTNVLSFGAGITAAGIKAVFEGDQGPLTLDLGNGDSIAIGSISDYAVQTLQFSDGTTLSIDEFMAQAGGNAMRGTEAADSLLGTPFDDRLEGLGGNDNLNARDGNDTLAGSTGDDYLAGGLGNDTYLFNPGDGIDRIEDSGGGVDSEIGRAETNTLVFGDGIAVEGVTPGIGESGELTLDVGNGDSLAIGTLYDPAIQVVRFPDGSEFTTQEAFANLLASERIANQVTAQNDSFAFTVPDNLFLNPRGDALVFSAKLADGSELPAWLRFDADTRTFSGYPENEDVASLSLVVTATYPGGLVASSPFALEVLNVNDNPYLANPLQDQTVTSGQAFSLVLPADTFRDKDAIFGDALEYSVTMSDGSDLPAWLTFDAQTGELSGTPDESSIGGLSLTITATDSAGDYDLCEVYLNVLAPGNAPFLVTPVADQTVREGELFEFTIPADTFDDVDLAHGDYLYFDIALADGNALPDWISVDWDTLTFRGTPGKADVGTISVTVTAYDSTDRMATDTFDITVAGATAVNQVPVAMNDAVTVTEDVQTSVSGNVLANDSDPDAGTVLTVADPGIRQGAYGTLTVLADGTSTYQLDNGLAAVQSLGAGQSVIDRFSYQASDGTVATPAEISVTVTGRNDAPVAALSLTKQTVKNGDQLSYQLPAGLFTDVDNGDQLSYRATLSDGSALPAWLAFDAATGAFSGKVAGAVGTLQLQVTATDLAGATASTSFSLEIANQAPVAMNDAATATEDDPSAIVGNLLANDSDPDAGTVLKVADPGIRQGVYGTLTVLADGTSTYQLDNGSPAVQALGAGQSVVDHFSYQASDGTAATPAEISVTVTGRNDAPVAALTLTKQTVKNGDQLSYRATLADGSALPAWLAFDAATGSFSGKVAGAVGTLQIQVTATDQAGATASTSFSLEIANQAPVAMNDAVTVTEDVQTSVSGNVLANDSDPDAGTVLKVADPGIRQGVYGTLTVLADGSSRYELDNTAAAVQALGAGQSVVEHFSYQSSDGTMATQGDIAISVVGQNDAPVVAVPLPDTKVAANTDFSWKMPISYFSDVDVGDTLVFSATLADGSALPAWVKFDAASQAFSGHVPKGVKGSLDIRVTASDNHGPLSMASDVFRVTVGAGGNDDKQEHGNEGVGNGEDAPPPGHDSNHNDGSGTSPGNPGSSGNSKQDEKGDSGNSAAQKDKQSANGSGSKSSSDDKKGRSYPVFLDPSLLDSNTQEIAAEGKNTSGDITLARWGEADKAVSRISAMNDEMLGVKEIHGADISVLNSAASGLLGANSGYVPERLSVVANSGAPAKLSPGSDYLQRVA